MNADDYHLSQRKNSSSDKKGVKSIQIHTNEFFLTPSKSNTTSNKKKFNFPKPKYYSSMKKDNKNSINLKLSSMHKSSIKNRIFYERELNLLKNKNKKLDEETHKIMSKINNSENMKKLKEERKINYKNKQNFLSNLLKEKEKEMKEKKYKVKLMKSQEIERIKNIVIYRKINSENLSEKKRILKKKILQDISEVKNKINQEKKRKINLIKIVDNDIYKRKKETEKRKKLMEKKQLEQEIKIQENFNKQLAIKICEFKKIGLDKINFLQRIKLKLENKF